MIRNHSDLDYSSRIGVQNTLYGTLRRARLDFRGHFCHNSTNFVQGLQCQRITLGKEDEGTLQLLITALSSSKRSGKSIYASCIQSFRERQRNQMRIAVEAMLCADLLVRSYKRTLRWNQSFRLFSGHPPCKGRETSSPIYLGSLYARLDECGTNILRNAV